MSKDEIIEESFSSDEDFDCDDASDSSTDVDAKVAEDNIFDVQFLKCYSALKKKDDKIYDPNVKFFEDNESDIEIDGKVPANYDQSEAKKLTVPKMTLLDMQLNLAKGDDEQEMENPKFDLSQHVSKSFYEKELEEIKKSIEKVGEEMDSESDDDLLVVKGSDCPTRKSKINTILDRIENEDDEDIEHLKQVWTNPDNLSAEDKYLRDYILNKRYLDNKGGNDLGDAENEAKDGFFSKNLEDMSDADSGDEKGEEPKSTSVPHRSDEKDFDKIVRIPRNATKTIRDMVEKQEKKEKRMKKLEKEKKRKQVLKDADCEDIVGDLATKFHYRNTEPNDYGLSAEELLMATDEELDQWISLHECVAYRTEEQEKALKAKYDSRRHDMELKRKIFKSIYGEGDADLEQQASESPKLKRGKKKRSHKRKRNTDSESSLPCPTVEITTTELAPKPEERHKGLSNNQLKKKKRKRGLNHKKFAAVGVAPDRLLAYGLSKSKLRKSKIM